MKSVRLRNFFWSVFSCIWTKYGGLLRKSPYSVRIQEKTPEKTDQKKLRIWTLFTQCASSKCQAKMMYDCCQKIERDWLPVYGNYKMT